MYNEEYAGCAPVWTAAHTLAEQLGQVVDEDQRNYLMVWQRVFESGTVYVNMTATSHAEADAWSANIY